MAREISKRLKNIFKLSQPPVCRLGDVDKLVAEFLMGIEGAATWLLALVACAFGPVNVSLGVSFHILKTWEAAKSEPCQEECTRGLSELSLKRGHGGPKEACRLEPWLRHEHGRMLSKYTSILGTF